MATLKDTHKRFIVEALACFDGPQTVADAFKEEFGIEIVRQQVANYDGSKERSRQRMSKALVSYFDECRETFKNNYEQIPIANKTRRLLMLQRMFDASERQKNFPLAKDLLEQAAKEVGDAYTNKKSIDVTSGGEQIAGVVFTKPGEE